MRVLKNIMKFITVYIVIIMFTGCSRGEDQVILLGNQSDEESMSVNSIYSVKLPEQESQVDMQHDSIYVYVCGAVNQPGVYELPADARVFEAIEAAAGYLEGAAVEYMNQAALLTDGQQIRIPTMEEVQEWAESAEIVATVQGQETDSGLININTASASQLMTLSGIGEAKARAIIAYRENKGSFKTIEELMNIEGIKEGVFNKLKDQITVQ